ncbi:MAG: prolipoprotein diacylglyceryl transferase [Oscillospiraceae bacterium]|nr:prolipoprotein diacylglyceryl transferase [Oscillospiraceae bacterium]
MTYPITFPGLGLELNPGKVAFSFLGKDIYWYGIIIACGFLLAVFYCSKKSPSFGVSPEQLLDLLIFAVPISVVGARLYYIIFYFSLFQKDVNGVLKPDFKQMVFIWDGGLAIYGGIIAGVLTLLVFCRIRKISFGAFLDVACFGLLIGQALGRWGNFFNREAYGGETTLPWRMGLHVPAENGIVGAVHYIEVHPTFLYESLWNALGFVLLVSLARRCVRKFDGQFFLLYMAWYGFGRGFIEGFRSDSLYFFGLKLFGVPIRASQVLAFLSCAIAIILLIYNLKFRTHRPEDLFINQKKEPPIQEERQENQ